MFKRIRKDLNEVFIGSALIVVGVVVFGLSSLDTLASFAKASNSFVAAEFGWLYILVMNLAVVACLLLFLPRFEGIRLGKSGEGPEFSRLTWLAMLFTAGIGIGLFYYGMAEPLLHGINPPTEAISGSEAAFTQGFHITFLHYGVHPWAVYAIVGLALLYYTERYDLPLRISSLLYPMIGDKVRGWQGAVIDICAILAILFGVSTTLGVGVQQINGGMNFLWGVPVTREVQVGLIVGVTLLATLSVVTGVDKGIKILSVGTAALSMVLLAFVLCQNSPMVQAENLWLLGSGFVADFLSISLSEPTSGNQEWQQNWTTFYWAWWIAWAPFVGMFISRISKGRSLREYIIGTMMIPSGFCCFWVASFGFAALQVTRADGGVLRDAITSNFSIAFFEFLAALPMSGVTSILTIILLMGFFVTSSDSGSLVVDMIAAKGNPHPPVWQRVFWSVMEGGLAATLLLAGGLSALQAGSLLSALPFSIIIVFVIGNLFRDFIRQTARGRDENPEVIPIPVKPSSD